MRTRAVPRWENMRLGCSQVGKYETGAAPRWENMQYRVYEGLQTSTFSLGSSCKICSRDCFLATRSRLSVAET